MRRRVHGTPLAADIASASRNGAVLIEPLLGKRVLPRRPAAEFIRKQIVTPAASRKKADDSHAHGSRTVLLVDDHSILYRAGTQTATQPMVLSGSKL